MPGDLSTCTLLYGPSVAPPAAGHRRRSIATRIGAVSALRRAFALLHVVRRPCRCAAGACHHGLWTYGRQEPNHSDLDHTPRSPTASTCERRPSPPCRHFRAIPGTAPTRIWSMQRGGGRGVDFQSRRLVRNRGLLPVRPLCALVTRRRVRPPLVTARPTGLAGPRVCVQGAASPRPRTDASTLGIGGRQGGSTLSWHSGQVTRQDEAFQLRIIFNSY